MILVIVACFSVHDSMVFIEMETRFSVTPRKVMVTVKLRAGAPKDFQTVYKGEI